MAWTRSHRWQVPHKGPGQEDCGLAVHTPAAPLPGSTFLLGEEGGKPSPSPTPMREPCPGLDFPPIPSHYVGSESCSSQATTLGLPLQAATDLVQLEGDHGDSMEDGCCRTCDGGDALGARAFRDGNPGTALQVQDKHGAVGLSTSSPGPRRGRTATFQGHSLVIPDGGFRERVGQGSPLPPNLVPWVPLPNCALTCSRIRFTVSPFCRDKTGDRLFSLSSRLLPFLACSLRLKGPYRTEPGTYLANYAAHLLRTGQGRCQREGANAPGPAPPPALHPRPRPPASGEAAPTHLAVHQHPQSEGDAELRLLFQPRV